MYDLPIWYPKFYFEHKMRGIEAQPGRTELLLSYLRFVGWLIVFLLILNIKVKFYFESVSGFLSWLDQIKKKKIQVVYTCKVMITYNAYLVVVELN